MGDSCRAFPSALSFAPFYSPPCVGVVNVSSSVVETIHLDSIVLKDQLDIDLVVVCLFGAYRCFPARYDKAAEQDDGEKRGYAFRDGCCSVFHGKIVY